MCSLQPKKQLNIKNPEIGKNNKEEDDEEGEIVDVTRYLYLKPAHRTGNLDKAVVLRRIRHRKRVNKVKSALQALLGSSSASNSGETANSVPQTIRWADDAFAAP